jgi:hypothetical protein
MNVFEALLDSGDLYLAIGAVICIVIGIVAVRRMFRGASDFKRPEPHDRSR